MRFRFGYFLLDTGILLISLIPMPILHGLSSLFCFVVRDIVAYRKQVITRNLKMSFPDADESEIRRYRRQFYLNFTDLLLETIKTRSASKSFLTRRCRISNLEVLDALKDRDFILVCGHRGNWEWVGLSFDLQIEHTTYTVYKPLSSGSFDRLMKNIRQRHGTVMVPMNKILREMKTAHAKAGMYVFLADQSPPRNEIQRNIVFLNQLTPVYLGPEKLARATGMPVVFFDAIRVGRGRYLSSLQIMTMEPQKEPEGYITDRFHELLEQVIREQIPNWLWSHRRWKYAIESGS